MQTLLRTTNAQLIPQALRQESLDSRYIDGASLFKFQDGKDCTGAFRSLHDFLQVTPFAGQTVIGLPGGTLYSDNIAFSAYNSVAKPFSTFSLEGVGTNQTIISPNVTTNPIFAYMDAGFIHSASMKRIQFVGNEAAMPNQHGLCFISQPGPGDNVGGLWYSYFEQIRIRGFGGCQMIWKGSTTQDNLMPMQFNTILGFRAQRSAGNHNPTVMFIGQQGQLLALNFQADGTSRTNNAGPNIYIGSDPRKSYITVSAVDTVNEFFTTSTLSVRTAQPLRIIGNIAGLTSTPQLALGTTIYAAPKNYKTAWNNLGVASSPANAAAGTLIDLTAGGTPANYAFVTFWAFSLVANEYTYADDAGNPLAHLLSTGDSIIPRDIAGGNLPAGLTNGTPVFVIVTSQSKFKLASTFANAGNGVALTLTGGTITGYGFSVGDPANSSQVYQMEFRTLTAQNGETGVMCTDQSEGIEMTVYGENLKRFVEVWGGSKISVRGGRLGSCANDGGNGLLVFAENAASSVTWDDGSIRVAGTTDNYFATLNGPASVITNNGNKLQALAQGATINVRAGNIVQYATLTGPMAIPAPTNATQGDIITVRCIQDGTGGRTVTPNAVFKGSGAAMGSGTAGQRIMITAQVDSGGNWNILGTTGWY